MIFKKNASLFGLVLTVLCAAQTYAQEIPEPTTTKKRTFVYHVGEKLNINVRDITQGAAIGSALFGASFLVKDQNLKLVLRALAIVPMICGIFAPKKIITKASKLELDEARCSNFKCTGICSDCRITKSYIAASLTMIPLYGIMWMFKKPATLIVPAEPINPTAPIIPAPAPIEPNPIINPIPEPNPILAPLAPVEPNPVVSNDDQQEQPNNISEPAQPIAPQEVPVVIPPEEPIAPQELQARPTAEPNAEPNNDDAAQEVEHNQEPEIVTAPAAQNPITEQQEEEPGWADRLNLILWGDQDREQPDTSAPAAEEPVHAPAAHNQNVPVRTGWIAWFTDKAAEALTPNNKAAEALTPNDNE